MIANQNDADGGSRDISRLREIACIGMSSYGVPNMSQVGFIVFPVCVHAQNHVLHAAKRNPFPPLDAASP